MQYKPLAIGAVIGLTLIALVPGGSRRAAAHSIPENIPAELSQAHERGSALLTQAKYLEAHEAFEQAASVAERSRLPREACKELNYAGYCLMVSLNYRGAEKDYQRSLDTARRSGQTAPLAGARNNLANLYLHMGEKEKALRMATDALAGPEGSSSREAHSKLLYQRATALAEMDRFAEAEPAYKQVIQELLDQNDLDSVSRIEGDLGTRYLKLGRLDDAEPVLNHALWTAQVHRLKVSAILLSALGQLKSRRGDVNSAAQFFDAALNAPLSTSPVWFIRANRGRFRLEHDDLAGALDDFREARRVALEMRVDMVPSDQDRVALETGLSSVMEGLVEAGNRLARRTGNQELLKETFDAAEQDRLWSLRALVPSPSDWRSRLPAHYWELLAQFQALERTAVAGRSEAQTRKLAALRSEMEAIESGAAGEADAPKARGESAMEHIEKVLPPDSVLFSFLVTESAGWVWAVDRDRAEVFPVAAPGRIKADVAALEAAVRAGNMTDPAASATWTDLFGAVPASYLKQSRWLIEPDGPLSNLPFAALRTPDGSFALEHASIESIPGALLLERGGIPADAPFLGIGDPVYNRADPRYRGKSAAIELSLPRLPGTARELESCSRAWSGGTAPQLLTGADATAERVGNALRSRFGIVHFATHVVTAPGEFRSGLIALSLDPSGSMGLLGPREIVARPVTAALVVMNGCHSAQGETLPGSGLMGLTRAWIGAGARTVISTAWDVPDRAAEAIMTDFYQALRAKPEAGVASALRQAQSQALRRGGQDSATWAAYTVLSRIP